jgi:hypothetical protein
MPVRLVESVSRPRIGRLAEPRSEVVLTDRASAVVVEPHQQPATTQARWIGRSTGRLVPIVLRWSMGDDSPRWPASRGKECDVRRLGRRTSPEPPSSGANPSMWNDVEAGGTEGVRHGRRGATCSTSPGNAGTAPVWRSRRRSAGETTTGGRRRENLPVIDTIQLRRPPGRGGAGFSASEWPGCGFVSVAVRRAEAQRGPGRSTLPVTRSGSRAGPFRSIPWWPFGKCREQRMIRTPLHRHRPKVRDVVRRMTYSQQPSCLDDARIAFV